MELRWDRSFSEILVNLSFIAIEFAVVNSFYKLRSLCNFFVYNLTCCLTKLVSCCNFSVYTWTCCLTDLCHAVTFLFTHGHVVCRGVQYYRYIDILRYYPCRQYIAIWKSNTGILRYIWIYKETINIKETVKTKVFETRVIVITSTRHQNRM
jgi:hypothetical protein